MVDGKTFQNTYRKIHDSYVKEGKSETVIRQLLILDIRNSDFRKDYDVDNTYGGGEIFAFDKKAMNWLFGSAS